MKNRTRIILDSDPGIDDSLAILLALASPEIIVEGITIVHGNCSVEQGTRNALNVLHLAGEQGIPVFQGYGVPIIKAPLFAPETHGLSGLGYAELPDADQVPEKRHAVEFLIDSFRQSPGEITLVAVGPLTNIAGAIRLDPTISGKIKEIFIMGGAIKHGGNTTPLAEFNVFADPHAAHIVFQSGIPITLTPLDVTYQCLLTADDVRSIQEKDSRIADFIADSTRFYMEFHDSYQGIKGCIINDPLTLALVFAPELCQYQDLYIGVDYSPGPGLGKTYADFYGMEKEPPNMQVAMEVNGRDFIDLFVERIKRYLEQKGGVTK